MNYNAPSFEEQQAISAATVAEMEMDLESEVAQASAIININRAPNYSRNAEIRDTYLAMIFGIPNMVHSIFSDWFGTPKAESETVRQMQQYIKNLMDTFLNN